MIPFGSNPSPLYLEPLGLVTRSQASDQAWLPVFGGERCALAIGVWTHNSQWTRRTLSASAIDEWQATLSPADQRRAQTIFANWARPVSLGGIFLRLGAMPALMGVVNRTDDSFHAASRRASTAAAVALGEQLFQDGAALIDVGGQSTRPSSPIVAVEREIERVLPTIADLARQGITVSVDTVRAEVAQAAVAVGAGIVNDVSGLLPPPTLAKGAAIIIGHQRGNSRTMQRAPRIENGIFGLYDWAEAKIATFLASGIAKERIAFDPGFGFGKLVNHNHAIIQYLPLLTGLGVPIVLGVSRKASLGFLSGTAATADRLPASLAAAIAAARSGAAILRVHDVAATRQALQIANLFG